MASGASRVLAVHGLGIGWLDDLHVIMIPAADVNSLGSTGGVATHLEIVDVTTSRAAPVAVPGVFVGTVPEGL
jgi:hypothetical protein